jgi:hypothetical protein
MFFFSLKVTALPQPTTPAVDKKDSLVDEKTTNNKENVMSLPQRDIRVKSPDCRRLQKASSSAEDSSFSKSQSSSINSLDQVKHVFFPFQSMHRKHSRKWIRKNLFL